MTVNGINIYTKIIGDGYPILMMHGGPGLDHKTLLSLSKLSKNYKLIYYDHRCTGLSKGPDIKTMSWENLTKDVDEIRKELKIERFALLGHSFGGMYAMEYTLRYPSYVSHLILIDTGSNSWWLRENVQNVLISRGYSKKSVEKAINFFNGNISPKDIIPSMLSFGSAYYYKINLLKVLFQKKVNYTPEAIIYGFKTLLNNWDISDNIKNINIPTLILAGEYDFQFPPEHQKFLSKAIVNSKLTLIDEAGHNAPVECPDKIVDEINLFFNNHH